MLNITSGKISRAQKIVVYGAEGIGKTTFASDFPNPLFIDTEGGTAHLDVNRLDMPAKWDDFVSLVEEVAKNPGICGTLVIDTADWAEQLCIKDICEKYKKAGIEEFGYSKGYTYVAEEFARFLAACDRVIAAGMNVLVTAHAKMRKFEQPDEMGAYDRWEMKLTKQVAPLLKEWSDMLLFCNYKTYVVSQDNAMMKSKGQGGKRVIYTSHHPCWDAKNRHGLPAELDLSFEGIAHIFAGNRKSEPKETPHEKLNRMMSDCEIDDGDLQKLVSAKGHYPLETPVSDYQESFLTRWVFPNWDKIVSTIKNM